MDVGYPAVFTPATAYLRDWYTLAGTPRAIRLHTVAGAQGGTWHHSGVEVVITERSLVFLLPADEAERAKRYQQHAAEVHHTLLTAKRFPLVHYMRMVRPLHAVSSQEEAAFVHRVLGDRYSPRTITPLLFGTPHVLASPAAFLLENVTLYTAEHPGHGTVHGHGHGHGTVHEKEADTYVAIVSRRLQPTPLAPSTWLASQHGMPFSHRELADVLSPDNPSMPFVFPAVVLQVVHAAMTLATTFPLLYHRDWVHSLTLFKHHATPSRVYEWPLQADKPHGRVATAAIRPGLASILHAHAMVHGWDMTDLHASPLSTLAHNARVRPREDRVTLAVAGVLRAVSILLCRVLTGIDKPRSTCVAAVNRGVPSIRTLLAPLLTDPMAPVAKQCIEHYLVFVEQVESRVQQPCPHTGVFTERHATEQHAYQSGQCVAYPHDVVHAKAGQPTATVGDMLLSAPLFTPVFDRQQYDHVVSCVAEHSQDVQDKRGGSGNPTGMVQLCMSQYCPDSMGRDKEHVVASAEHVASHFHPAATSWCLPTAMDSRRRIRQTA